jgi:hypothetical protein
MRGYRICYEGDRGGYSHDRGWPQWSLHWQPVSIEGQGGEWLWSYPHNRNPDHVAKTWFVSAVCLLVCLSHGKWVPSRGSAESSPEQVLPSYIPCHYRNHHNMTVSILEFTIRPRWCLPIGAESGNTHGHPLVAISGSVAARKTAHAMRGTGVSGRPVNMSLEGGLRMEVSFRENYLNWIGKLRTC